MRAAWHVLSPADPLVWSWHYDLISEYLTLVKQRKVRRLIINVPPRMMKSLQCTVSFPAWVWSTQPEHRFLCASYSKDLSTEHSVKRRNLIQSDWYQAHWQKIYGLSSDQNVKTQFHNDRTGQMIATSVGGTATGKGGDTLILDDPVNPEQAFSDVERKNANDWFDNTFRSRLNNPATGAIIVIMQRLHEEDTTGYLLSREASDWTHIKLPLVAEHDERWVFPLSGRIVERKEGETLQAERFTEDVVSGLKKRSRVFAGQYQQRPAPQEGNVIKRGWVRYWGGDNDVPLPDKFDQVIQSWDCTFKKTEESDFVAGWVVGTKGADRYVLDREHGRMGFTETIAAIRRMRKLWPKAHTILIEDKANGPAIIDTLRKEITGIIAVEPEGGKEARMHAAAPEWESGNWHLPRKAPWAEQVVTELTTFPNAAHDDDCDAMSQASIRLKNSPGGLMAFMQQKHEALQKAKAEADKKQ